MSDLKAYLAEKYMSGPKAEAILSRVAPKKKKRKGNHSNVPAAGGATLVDDDAGWGDTGNEEKEDLSEAIVEKDRGFKKRSAAEGSGWATVKEGDPSGDGAAPVPADEQPVVVVDAANPKPFVGGLVSASQLQTILPKTTSSQLTQEEIELSKETVHRDAQGRKIDTKAERAEAARRKREKEEKEALMMEWGKGLVQREEKEKMRLELEKQRGKGFTRYADDTELNEELKSKELWNDPAMMFMTKRKSKGPRRPQYNGPTPPPNRFGIKPGHRWDGVDRGNGFEKKWFQRSNERKRKGLESYQWSVDDM